MPETQWGDVHGAFNRADMSLANVRRVPITIEHTHVRPSPNRCYDRLLSLCIEDRIPYYVG